MHLTHGERTGACMRIGGVGSSLYEFALTNKNGFHIVFKDEENNYLSRVTGFRNGNTVFLNELRNSCDPAYSNKDIVSVCTKVAEDLIEYSKASSLPIDNVVVHQAYATSDITSHVTINGDIKEGLPYFYADVGNTPILLASRDLKGELIPFNSDKTKLPTYKPLRRKIVKTDKRNVIGNYVERVNFIKKSLDNEDYEYIEPLNLQDITFAYLNDDWYVCLDSKGNIYSDCILVDERCKLEYEQAIEEINEMVKKGKFKL